VAVCELLPEVREGTAQKHMLVAENPTLDVIGPLHQLCQPLQSRSRRLYDWLEHLPPGSLPLELNGRDGHIGFRREEMIKAAFSRIGRSAEVDSGGGAVTAPP